MSHIIKKMFCNHKGTGHKLAHNFTTLANIPLVAWTIYTVISLRGADYSTFQAWMSQPIHMVAGILFVLITLLHFTLEIEVVLEDYIPDLKLRHLIIKMMKVFFVVLGLGAIISLFKLTLVG